MAMVKCGECGREVSEKASLCPNCGAPVDVENALKSPTQLSYQDGLLVGTSSMIAELAKKAIANVNYRVDSANADAGTATIIRSVLSSADLKSDAMRTRSGIATSGR